MRSSMILVREDISDSRMRISRVLVLFPFVSYFGGGEGDLFGSISRCKASAATVRSWSFSCLSCICKTSVCWMTSGVNTGGTKGVGVGRGTADGLAGVLTEDHLDFRFFFEASSSSSSALFDAAVSLTSTELPSDVPSVGALPQRLRLFFRFSSNSSEPLLSLTSPLYFDSKVPFSFCVWLLLSASFEFTSGWLKRHKIFSIPSVLRSRSDSFISVI